MIGKPELTNWEIEQGYDIISLTEGYLKYKIMPDYVDFHAIHVYPEYRRKGHGHNILKLLEREKPIYVYANTDGTDEFGLFLLKEGFVKMEEKEKIYKELRFNWKKL